MYPTHRYLWRGTPTRRWWVWEKSRLLKCSPATTTTAVRAPARVTEQLPDTVVDILVRAARERDNRTSSFTLAPSCIARSALARLPPATEDKASLNGDDTAALHEATPHTLSEASAVTVGALYDALQDTLWCNKDVASQTFIPLELFFMHLAHLAPLLVRLDATAHHFGTLFAYCNEALGVKAAGLRLATTTNPYMQRLLRQTRVSWQPWVSAEQKARLIAGASSELGPERPGQCAQTSLAAHHRAANGHSPAPCGQFLSAEKERSWRLLLESVPPFFVAAELVRADMRDRHGDDGERLFDAWVSRRATFAASAPSAESGLPLSGADATAHEEPFLEVTADGCAVRAPAREACLQAGCPPRLIYNTSPTRHSALRSRHALMNNARFGAELMHAATALLAMTVPSTSCGLEDVRRLFSLQQSNSAVREQLAAASSSARPTCAAFFPCVEVLLEHPDLSFAVQIRERASGFARATLPNPMEEARGAPQHSIKDTLQIRLHPSFAHALRGSADVVLTTLQHQRRRRGFLDFGSGKEARGGTSATSCRVHVHYVRDAADVVPAGFAVLLRSADDAAAAPTVTLRAVKGVVYVSSTAVRRATHEATSVARSEEQGLQLAFACTPTRVDVVVVPAACIPFFLERVRAASSSKEEGGDGEPLRLLDACARLLFDSALVTLAPSRCFTGLSRPSSLLRLWVSLSDAALASLCTLEHVAHYAGYPVGSAVAASSDADQLIAAMIQRHHQVRFVTLQQETDADTIQKGAEQGLSGSAEEVWEAATVCVAALLLCRCREREVSILTASQSTSTADRVMAMSNPVVDVLNRWAGSAAAMRDYGVQLRLARYTRWLRCMGEDASFATAADSPATAAAARVALEGLCAAYGPEPFPDVSWDVRPVVGGDQGTCREAAEVHTHMNLSDAATLDAPRNDVITGTAAREDAGERQQREDTAAAPAPDSEQADVDVCLYDALLSEAAALQNGSATALSVSPRPTPAEGTSTMAASVDEDKEQKQTREKDETAASARPSSSSSPPPLAEPTDQQEQEDTLHFYLATVLGGDTESTATTTTANPPQPQQQSPPSDTQRGRLEVPAVELPIPIRFPPRPPLSVMHGLDRPFMHRGNNGSSLGEDTGVWDGADGSTAAGSAATRQIPIEAPQQPFSLFRTAGQATRCAGGVGFASASPSLRPAQSRSAALVSSSSPPAVATTRPLGGGTCVALFNPFGPQQQHQQQQEKNADGDLAPFFSAPASTCPPPAPPAAPPMPSATDSGALPLPLPHVSSSPVYTQDTPLDFLGHVTAAEKLRLASLIIDVLRGSSGSGPSRRPPY